MFQPRHFAEDRTELVVELARVAGFGHLVAVGPDGLASTPMPFLVDDEGTCVRAHLARPNPIWRLAPCAALLIVPVGDAYVSPGWYPSKVEHGRVVPTWNYEIVHLHGRLVAHDDREWLQSQVRDLTDHHESTMPQPWSVDDAPAEFIDAMVHGIVGVELEIDRIVGKRKLSQNRPGPDRAGVLGGLDGHDPNRTIAEAMRASRDGD